MWRTAVIATALIVCSQEAYGQNRVAAEATPMDCARWTKEGRGRLLRLTMILHTRALLRFNQKGRADLLKGKSDREIGKFLDEYCKAHPEENISAAIHNLEQGLVAAPGRH